MRAYNCLTDTAKVNRRFDLPRRTPFQNKMPMPRMASLQSFQFFWSVLACIAHRGEESLLVLDFSAGGPIGVGVDGPLEVERAEFGRCGWLEDGLSWFGA